jgi:hypothetical protein
MIQVAQDKGGWMHPSFCELADYLGPYFDLTWCVSDEDKAVEDRASFDGSDKEWTRRTLIFAYQNIALSTQGIHRPYLARLLNSTGDRYGLRVLDYGAGGGQMGLALHFLGYRVSFADIYGQSLTWLCYRLRALKLDLPVYPIDEPTLEIPHQHIALCFDVLEHLEPEVQKQTLERLGKLADIVFVNLIRDTDDSHKGIHQALDFQELTDFVASKWKCIVEDFYPDEEGKARQRLLMYGNVDA